MKEDAHSNGGWGRTLATQDRNLPGCAAARRCPGSPRWGIAWPRCVLAKANDAWPDSASATKILYADDQDNAAHGKCTTL